MMYTDGAQCTANFVFTDGAGNTYVGYAAHCAGTGAATDTDGCGTQSLPLGTKVDLQRGRQPGRRGHPGRHRHARLQLLADHAEERREGHQHLRLQRPRPGQGRRAPTSARSTRPCRSGAARPASTPTAPRPATGSTPTATPACAAASSELKPHTGASLGDDAADGGWSHPVYTVTPGIPGDSGSGFLSADGTALGVLSTVAIAPLAGSNGVGDLSQGARLRPGELRHRRPQPGQRHRAVLADALSAARAALPGSGLPRVTGRIVPRALADGEARRRQALARCCPVVVLGLLVLVWAATTGPVRMLQRLRPHATSSAPRHRCTTESTESEAPPAPCARSPRTSSRSRTSPGSAT